MRKIDRLVFSEVHKRQLRRWRQRRLHEQVLQNALLNDNLNALLTIHVIFKTLFYSNNNFEACFFRMFFGLFCLQQSTVTSLIASLKGIRNDPR